MVILRAQTNACLLRSKILLCSMERPATKVCMKLYQIPIVWVLSTRAMTTVLVGCHKALFDTQCVSDISGK